MNIDENVLLNVDADTEGTEFGSSTEDAVIKTDSNEYLMNQILKLPFTESQVIIMKYYQDLKLNEIAQLMDISQKFCEAVSCFRA